MSECAATNYAAALAALDKLAETERGATPGPWECDDCLWPNDSNGRGIVRGYDADIDDVDALAIVALRNIAPELIALARAVVAERHLGENLRAPMDFDAKDDALIARLDATDALIAALTEAGPPAGED